MSNSLLTILLVDDDPLNLTILEEYMEAHRLRYFSATNGAEALAMLEKHPEINLLLLDRVMPVMNGIEVVRHMKKHAAWRDIPVIMQTAAHSPEHIEEGMKAGVFYYLTKPYEENTLMAVVLAAEEQIIQRQIRIKDIQAEAYLCLHYRFRSIEEVLPIITEIGSYVPCDLSILIGLQELMLNAVEHGNLAISYAQKRDWKLQGTYEQNLRARMADKTYGTRLAELYLVRNGSKVRVTINDEGAGFDPTPYFSFDPRRMTDPNGRGIAMCMGAGFEAFDYEEGGKSVVCRFLVLGEHEQTLSDKDEAAA